jgi:uncharacterized protein (PEP-CTERM system associated)
LQQNQTAAPAILIQPRVSVGETLTTNVFNTATNRVRDLETQLVPGLSISADMPQLQGVLTSQLEYDRFLKTSSEDQLFGNLYASGTATAIQDHLFLDAKGAVTPTAQFGAAGFAPISQLPKSQTTQLYSSYLSPYFRESYAGEVDAELRYSFASTNSGSNADGGTTLSNSVSNEGTLTIATGRDFERLLSRLTIDVSQLNANAGSIIPNSRVSAYDDVEYRITSMTSVLGRLGYENIRYPFAPAATATGILWQVGGRLWLGPGNQYLSLRYGKEEGIYGVTGSLRYEITPATVLIATAVQGVGSQQAGIQSNLAGSSLDAYGRLVNQYDLPTAFVNPEFALQNNIFRTYLYQAGITSSVGSNTFFLFGFYNRQVSLAIPQPPTTSIGANFGWTREIRPDLTAYASVGYANVTNQTVVTLTEPLNFGGINLLVPLQFTTISSQNTANASLSLNYQLSRDLTGSIVYSLYYQTNGPGPTLFNTSLGNVVTNRLMLLLTKNF